VAIKAKAGTKDDSLTGKTQAKYDAEDVLSRVMLQVGSGAFAYANKVNNAVLRAKSNFTQTGIRRMKDMDRVTTANALVGAVSPIVEKLADFNVAPANVTELQAAADNYEKTIGDQGSGVSQHSSAVMNLAELFHAVDLLLNDQLDPLVQSLERVEPVFVREYKQLRSVREHSGPHKQDKNNTQSSGQTPAAK